MRREWGGWGTFLFALAMVSTLLLIYASLVPLNYQPLPWKATYLRWKSIPWLEIKLYSRSDWIANALVVMPAPFFLCGAVDAGRRSWWKVWVSAPFIFVFYCAVVVGIEMLQVWFPPRTVSQNDILAGCFGAIGGVLAWLILGRWCVFALESFTHIETVEKRLRWLVGLGCIGSLFYTLYPFDFVVSADELKQKVALGRLSWALDWQGRGKMELIKGIGVAVLKLIPFGLWFGLAKDKGRGWLWLPMIAIGMEVVQIPIYTKFASLVEVGAGMVGGWIGYAAPFVWRRAEPVWSRKGFWLVAIGVWSLVLWIAFNARYEEILTNPEIIRARWRAFFSWPLLRYYYTSEYSAFSNLLGKLIVFGVLGVLVALASVVSARGTSAVGESVRWGFWLGMVWSLGLGVVIEVAQVYLPPILGDMSDIGIYAVGYGLGFWLSLLVVRPSS